MKKHATIITLLFPLLLGACASSTPPGAPLADIIAAQSAKPVAALPKCSPPTDLIGQSHTIIPTKRFNVPVRVIFPGSAPSADQISNRYNFKVNKKGLITAVTCG